MATAQSTGPQRPTRGAFPLSARPRRWSLVACAALAVAALAAGSAQAARHGAGSGKHVSVAGFTGVWVATGSSSKIVLRLRLRGSRTRYRGTYTLVRHLAGKTKKKVLRVTARSGAADGARQLTLTFTATRRSTLCGLVGTRLYCQIGTSGPTVFVRR